MTTASETETIPQTGFDPAAFWLAHKSKIIIYSSIVIVAVLGFALYEISHQRAMAGARLALSTASSEDEYRDLIQKFPGTAAAGDASLLLAEKLRDDKKYDDAIATLQAMIDHQPNHPLIDGAWLSLAATYNVQGKLDQALDTYKQVATKFADRASAPQALYAVAEILKSQGKLDDAKIAYENVNSQYHDSLFAQEALEKLQLLKK